MEHKRLLPTKNHIRSNRPREDWHLTKDEWEAVNRFGDTDRPGLMPCVFMDNLKWQPVPGTPYSHGKPGQKARDNDYLYICVRNNLWKRAPMEDSF